MITVSLTRPTEIRSGSSEKVQLDTTPASASKSIVPYASSNPAPAISSINGSPTSTSTPKATADIPPINRAERTTMRSEEHTSELQSLMRNSYAVFCLKTKNNTNTHYQTQN